MTTPNPFPGFDEEFNPFLDFLEEERNIPFQSALQGANLTPNQLQFFQNDRRSVFDRFDALFGNQIQQGEIPNARFTDFIGDFNFNQAFRDAPGAQQFQQTQRFNPALRFLS